MASFAASVDLHVEPEWRVICSGSMQDRRAETCRQKASECQRRAVLASDEGTRQTYHELARQWRYMAKQAEELERRRLAKESAASGGEVTRVGGP